MSLAHCDTTGTILADIRTESVRVRVTPAEKEIIETAAQMEGVDVSVLMRGAIRKEVIRIYSEAGEENPFRVTTAKRAKKRKTDRLVDQGDI